MNNFLENAAAFVCRGHVTKQAYDSVLVPAVKKLLDGHDKVRLYYETANDFAGIDERVILAHGDLIESDARRVVEKAWARILIDERR